MQQTHEEYLQKRVTQLQSFLSTIDQRKQDAPKQLAEYQQQLDQIKPSDNEDKQESEQHDR